MRILGFSVAHDSSACIINDGELEYFGKEERYTREKRDKQPYRCVEKAIEAAKGPIDFVVMQSPTAHPACTDVFRCFVCKKSGINEDNFIDLTADHHISHAFHAYNNAGFETALCFVIDRDGSQIYDPDDMPIEIDHNGNPKSEWVGRECESVYLMRQPAAIKAVQKNFWMRNPINPRTENNQEKGYYDFYKKMQGKFPGTELQMKSAFGITKVYESGTTMIGEGPLENGKTMGLSAYGDDKVFPPLFIGTAPIDQYFVHESWVVGVASLRHKILSKVTEDNYQPYADWALHIQKETQHALHTLVRKWVDNTGIKDVILTGGYALNVVANNYLIKNNPDVNFYIEPNADDTGNSLGAAWYVYKLNSQDDQFHSLKDTFYHSLEPQDPIEGESVTAKDIAEIISEGRSVAIYDGNPEAGPRALGHRSILFDPRNKDARDQVNLIKKREWYRPFAGVILEECFGDYFDTIGLKSAPNMTVSFDALDKAKEQCPGIIHVDGTCRMQTVTEGFMKDVLWEFYVLTGVPVLLNTSFNLAGEALVHTKQDALDTLKNSMLDYVYFVQDDALVN